MAAVNIKGGSPAETERANDIANGWVLEIDREIATPRQKPPGDTGAYADGLRAARAQLIKVVGSFTAGQVIGLAAANKNPARDMIRKAAETTSAHHRP